MDRIQRLDAKVGFQLIGVALRQRLAGEPVHDLDQVEEPITHRQIRDVRSPDLVRPFHPQSFEQIWPDLVSLGWHAYNGHLEDRH